MNDDKRKVWKENMVGLVIVSHSKKAAEGILELILPDVSAVSETPIKNPDYLYMTYGRGDSNPSEDTKSENDEYTEADADSGKSLHILEFRHETAILLRPWTVPELRRHG